VGDLDLGGDPGRSRDEIRDRDPGEIRRAGDPEEIRGRDPGEPVVAE